MRENVMRENAVDTFFRYLLRPRYWVMNYPYCEAWDKKLRELMTAHRFEAVDRYHARIDGILVWVANHPYASFTPVDMGVRPSRRTIEAAHLKYVTDVFEGVHDG